jgi:hypothetical protein
VLLKVMQMIIYKNVSPRDLALKKIKKKEQ